MLTHIEIQNFQSHKFSFLNFHAGLNGIVGDSDSGKSAILRALHWNRDNRPTGEAHISKWAKDTKGKLLAPCRVVVGTSSGEVVRLRSPEFNGYAMGDQKFEAIGTSVPDEVLSAWNFSEVNVQKQLDPPFLLSKSGPEVSRFFNQILNLDDMDKLISAAASRQDKTATELKEIVGVKGKSAKQDRLGKLDELDLKISKLEWIESAKEILAVAKELESQIDKATRELSDIDSLCFKIKTATQQVAKFQAVLLAEPVLLQAVSASEESASITKQATDLEKLYNGILRDTLIVAKSEMVLEAEPFLTQAMDLSSQITNTQGQIIELDKLTFGITQAQATIAKAEDLLQAENILATCAYIVAEQSGDERKIQELTIAVRGIESANLLIARASKIIQAEPVLTLCETAARGVAEQTRKQGDLLTALIPIRKAMADIESKRAELEVLEKEIPEQCPTCGNIVPHKH